MPATPALRRIPSALLFAALPALAFAADGEPVAEPAATIDEVTIIGVRRNTEDIPGSAHVLEQEDLQAFLQSDVMRVLRTVPGVYVQEEDGFGLRPNIGIRGSGLDRSARIALLEDNVLIAPAPYAAPSAYYFPTQRRIHSLEVLKGPSSIAVGPRTTGGAVNLVSTPIPDAFGGTADLRIGQHETIDAHLNVGNRGERFSWLVETVQQQNDGFKTIDGPLGRDMGGTGYDIEDYIVKAQFDTAPGASLYQSLRVKGGYTDQVADETYLGLTEDDFRQSPYSRYAASAGDVFKGEHDQLQASYVFDTNDNFRGEVTAYRNNFARNWYKLQSVDGAGLSDVLADPVTFAQELGYLKGATSPDDAIVKRANNREYYSQGIQGQVSWDLTAGNTNIALTAGMRVHEDEEDRLQHEDGFRMQDSLLVLTSEGAPGSNTNRVSSADAISYFVDTEIRSGNWILTPGARFEDIDMRRLDYATSDPARALGPTQVRENSASVLIPGVGALYLVNDSWRVLGGVHKGFNPPGPGSAASEESSINYEIGTRFNKANTRFEAIYFLNDYDNLVGTVTASTGGGGQIGDQFDAGAVSVQGVELSVDFAATDVFAGVDVPLSFQYTWTYEAEFENSFESDFEPWGDVQAGDELPYIPEHQLRATGALEHERWNVNLAANYIGKMRTVAGQGAFVAAETIDSHVVWDFLARWRFTESLSSYIKVDNLFDETYVAARRPAGLRPGLERTAYLGVTFSL